MACERTNEPAPGAEDLRISWTLEHNALPDEPGAAQFVITNVSEAAFPASGWAIYYSQLAGGVRANSLPATVTIEHLGGDWYRLAPTDNLSPIAPGGSLVVDYQPGGPVNKESWAPQGLYIVFTDADGTEGEPEILEDYVVTPFTSPGQINRGPGDQTPIPTATSRFADNADLSLLPAAELVRITPAPVSYREGSRPVTLDAGWSVHYVGELDKEANFLATQLGSILGQPVNTQAGAPDAANRIHLQTGTVSVAGKAGGPESYELTIDPDSGVRITGADAAGVFYGIQSLLAYLPAPAWAGGQPSITVNELTVADAPRFGYRGFHLDMARNFQTKETIYKVLDLMASYKLNRFHFHFSEDEGWRLEIPELPELTEVGSRRGHTLTEEDMLHPSYGSGPFPDPEISHGSGYYTRQEFIEILRYARDRHIQVIPEVEGPGHARAAIISMKARARRTGSEEYLLHDPNDQSEYNSAQNYDDNVMCPCRESTYNFLETVIRSIVDMYREAEAPLEMFHIGGDEVPGGVWEKSPICQEFLRTSDQAGNVVELNYYFVRRAKAILDGLGLKTAGWEEVALAREQTESGIRYVPHPEFDDGNVVPYVWNNVPGSEDLGNRLANAGYPIVQCNVTNFYFDLAYNKDPLEPGLSWGGFVNTFSAFEFIPEDVFRSARTNSWGSPIDEAALRQNQDALTAEGFSNILGLQSELWSETVKGPQMLEYYVFPKMLGFAERAWAPQPDWAKIGDRAQRQQALAQAWNGFANRLGQHELPRLDHRLGGVGYRLPLPGAVIENGLLKANVLYPGLTIRYTTDGSEPTADSPVYEGQVEVPATATIKLRTFDSRGRGSRTVEL